jgi:centrosomal CEP192-like protein/HYDIN/CFA65/VesB family protein
MPSPQAISRLLLIMLTIPFFLVSAASAAASASRSLASSPSSVSFGNVQVGSKQRHYETLTNSGNSRVTISQTTVTGAGFSLSGLDLPFSLDDGESVTFTVLFTPKAGGSTSGRITVVSNASNSSLTIALSGTGISAGQLNSSATAFNFGSVAVGTSNTLTATLTATGSSVTVSSATTTSSVFSLGGLSFPKIISAGQSVSFTMTFTPQASGVTSGSISLASNAANTPTVETLTGSGTATALHSVGLSWTPSASAVVGYNVYRSAMSGGPYTKATTAVTASTSYIDNSVQGGKTYYYVCTAVDSHGAESTYSNQLQAVIPSP